MRIILLNLPVHTPTVMPYSIAMMHAVLSSGLDDEIDVLDLNAEYHRIEFAEYYERLGKEPFFPLLSGFMNEARHRYPKISQAVVAGRRPEGYDWLMAKILAKKPDIVAISMAYNSQAFFAKGIISELTRQGVKVVLGGPADYSKVKGDAIVLPDYVSLLKYIIESGGREKNAHAVLDYSVFKDEYFTKDIIYPLRTAMSCPYRLCAFCTHHQGNKYDILDTGFIVEANRDNLSLF